MTAAWKMSAPFAPGWWQTRATRLRSTPPIRPGKAWGPWRGICAAARFNWGLRCPARKLLTAGLGAAVVLGGGFAFLQSAFAEVYQTEIGEQKHISLHDGTAVFLDTDTKLVVHFNDKNRMAELRYGRANFRVAADTQKRAFAVKAAQKLVIGTRSTFDVGREGDRVSVLLIQGRATVENSASDAVGSQC